MVRSAKVPITLNKAESAVGLFVSVLCFAWLALLLPWGPSLLNFSVGGPLLTESPSLGEVCSAPDRQYRGSRLAQLIAGQSLRPRRGKGRTFPAPPVNRSGGRCVREYYN